MSIQHERILAAAGVLTPAAKVMQQTADTLRAAREAAGMSQREVAAAMATSHAQVVRIENAQVHGVSLRSLADFAAAVGCEARVVLTPAQD